MLLEPDRVCRKPVYEAILLGLGLMLAWTDVSRANPIGDWLGELFEPPAVEMQEAYAPKPEGPIFDHTIFDGLLRLHVAEGGWVDYQGLAHDRSRLQSYLDAIGRVSFDALGRDEKLALLLNAYNAFTLELILEHGQPDSIRDIPRSQRWQAERWQVGSHRWSLDQIEHREIRAKFREPRIHFALVCAAVGCPPLRREAYRGSRLESQLEDQTQRVHADPRWVELLESGNRLRLTRLYDWYEGDFEQVAGSVLESVARHLPALRPGLAAGSPPRIEWIEYDWVLNDVKNRVER